MRKKIKRVSVLVNPAKTGVSRLVAEIREEFSLRGIDAVWHRDRKINYGGAQRLASLAREEDQLVMVIGGDGTLLQAARRLQGMPIPLLGINAGSLGFLTSLSGEQVLQQINRVLDGDYQLDRRACLECDHRRGNRILKSHWAMNEVAITRGAHSHLIRVDLKIGDEVATSYACDGLIMATPTGSTAYSVAAGGPILSPRAKVFVVTPICAHSLTNRPLVVGEEEEVQFVVPDKGALLRVNVDGVPGGMMAAGDRLVFRRARHGVMLAHLPEGTFYSILKQKLHWSGAV
ncbi:MAG: NAD(+)/NADH kinase [Candidatus Methylacidiphilales bacterium]